ncbi:MAG: hypothetical protein LBN06_05415 [Prevotellaceae bacterium]|jgi:hypothetical protein|nr:hypothetical protein [Prevotellaceae bacterium]
MKVRYNRETEEMQPTAVHEPYESYQSASVASDIECADTALPHDFNRGITSDELLAKLLPRIEKLIKQ